MITHPVSRYLVQFESGGTVKPAVHYDAVLQPLSLEPEHHHHPEDHEAQLLAARAEGHSEGYELGHAAAQADFNAALANQRLEYDKHLAEERNRWIAEESAPLALAITNMLHQFGEELGEAVDGVLRPFLIESLRRQMVEELAQAVGVLLASDENPAIVISGAADLLTVLRERLSSTSVAIEYRPSDSIDVQVVSHHTVIESQLRAWIARFELPKE
jgi:hypothetical protein